MSKKPYDAIEKVCSTGWPPPEPDETALTEMTVQRLVVVLKTATVAIGAQTVALLEARALLAKAQKVIEPFAKAAVIYDPPEDDDAEGIWATTTIKVGDLRAAHKWMDEALGINGKQAQDSP